MSATSLWGKYIGKEDTPSAEKSGGSSQGSSVSSTPVSVFAGLAGVGGLASPAPVTQVDVDPLFYSTLQSAVNNIPAPGLSELLLVAEGLTTAGIPQDKVFSVAVSVVSKKGITISQIGSELAKRLEALEGENAQLLGAADRQYGIDVGGKENQVASVDQQVIAIDTQIAGLEEKKKSLQADKANLLGEIDAKKRNIENKKAGLSAAYDKLKRELANLTTKVSS